MRLFFLFVCFLLTTGCSEHLAELREQYRPASARDAYVHALETSGISQRIITQRWLEAGNEVLEMPITPTLPYVENGYLVAPEVMALGYRLDLTRGQQLIVEATSVDGFMVFSDLYEPPGEGTTDYRRLSSADSTGRMTWDVRRSGIHLLRIQPEILADGRYEVRIRTGASLIFPVAGHSISSAQSLFGVERDGGRRSHNGIDIFAPRGTPVVAVRQGRVTRVQTTPRGGKQVWLRDGLDHNFYYAHLDSQLVREGQYVQPGDTLGLVGNTGNARTTPPHLHFGIYQGGPHDPWPFVHEPAIRPSRVAVDRSAFGSWRTTSASVRLRTMPTLRRGGTAIALEEAMHMHVVGGSAAWYHVRLVDGRSGYLSRSDFARTQPSDVPSAQRRFTSSVVGG